MGSMCTTYDKGFDRLFGQPGLVLVDVRSADEVRANSLDGSVHLPCGMGESPVAVMSAAISAGKVPNSRATPMIVFCASGGRASRAQAALRDLGYTQVMNGGSRDAVETARNGRS
eukprot:CAMPEP_0194524962 /NCGR_PEP_ID=MMETSP0253-20130528/60291_1 /TAXON_ID=2966 /ORGANISM="Noctiluca scintillans" /LENGTH=114 /DNA_ID=CAMNT_0039369651 /DNA_START=20 /DNA_END=364 /DNA_ORIENTATION=+